MEDSEDAKLEEFLVAADLSHLKDYFIEQGVSIEILCMANDSELTILSPKVVDKIKLRRAIEIILKSQVPTSPPEVKLIERTKNTRRVTENDHGLMLDKFLQDPELLSDLEDPEKDPFFPKETLSQDWNKQLETELKNVEGGKDLRQLLSSLTIGKALLLKADKGESLTSRDRAYIAKVIIETELRQLQDVSNTIRKNIWQDWAREVVSIFKGEIAELYYVPYHVVDGKVVQASGLFHNRLITHRRQLNTVESRKRRTSISSDSSSEKSQSKRIRPLPESFSVACADNNAQECLDWLQAASSPHDLVLAKWLATFHLRNAKLSQGLSYKEYFSCFPALILPNGHELLSLDFETVYPNANKVFDENFPTVKTKILESLAEKGSSSKQDVTTLNLLDLASVGEQQASLAALLGVVSLLRQAPTISIPRKKIWRLSKEELQSSFIGRVNTASEIERYSMERDRLVAAKGIPSQPYIIAVGTSWATISHFEIVIYNDLRYQIKDICSAIKTIYHVYWALDSAYPKDSAICWMFIQRALFNMKSKYDTEGVPLRELLHKLNV